MPPPEGEPLYAQYTLHTGTTGINGHGCVTHFVMHCSLTHHAPVPGMGPGMFSNAYSCDVSHCHSLLLFSHSHVRWDVGVWRNRGEDTTTS